MIAVIIIGIVFALMPSPIIGIDAEGATRVLYAQGYKDASLVDFT